MDKFTSGVHDLIRGAIPKGERKNFEELVDRSTKLKAAIFKVKPDKVWGAAYDYAVAQIGLYRLEVQLLGRVRSALLAEMADEAKVLKPYHDEKSSINRAYQSGLKDTDARERFMRDSRDVNRRADAARAKFGVNGTIRELKRVDLLLRAIPGKAANQFPRPTPASHRTWAADALVGSEPAWSPIDKADDLLFRHYADGVKKELSDPGRLARAKKRRDMEANRAKAGAPGRERAAAARAAMVARRRETWGHGE